MYIKYFLLLISFVLSSCIKNDIPYPKEILYVKDVKFLGQIGDAVINEDNFSIDVSFDEDVDLKKVEVKTLTTTQGAKSSVLVGDKIDLTDPFFIKLSKYQDYYWQVKPHQPIKMIFEIEDQVGTALFSKAQKKAIAYVSPHADLSKIVIKDIKLDKKGYDIRPKDKKRLIGKPVDFTKEQKVEIEKDGATEVWTLSVIKSKEIVRTLSADGLVRVAYLYGRGASGGNVGFEYKPVDANKWLVADDNNIKKLKDGSVVCLLKGLEPSTKYICRSTYNKEMKGNEIEFSTISEEGIPGGGDFDNFDKNYWDSSNSPGAGNVSFVADVPEEVGTGKSVHLESKSIFGVFASASVYLGKFVSKDGLTNAVLSFGKPYTSMPTRLNGYYKFKTSTINHSDEKYKELQGKPDSCFIYAMLIDRDPLEIRTNSSNRQLVDFDAKYVIAIASLTQGHNVDKWEKFSVPFIYRRTDIRPKYLVLVVSSSKYGDYFTGGSSTVLDIDNFSFSFD